MTSRIHAGLLLRALLPVALFAVAACGGGAAGEAAAASPPAVGNGAWVVMGSSSAAGSGATPGQAWAALLQVAYASRRVAVANVAKGGTTTYAGLPTSAAPVTDRPPPDPESNVDAALALSPKLLLVSYPTNDTALGYGVDETVRNLLAIRDAARARGVAVIVLSTQPRAIITSELERLPRIDAHLAQAVAPCFVPVRELLAGPSGTIDARYDSGDGIHLNDSGHAIVLAKVREVIDAGRCVRVVSP